MLVLLCFTFVETVLGDILHAALLGTGFRYQISWILIGRLLQFILLGLVTLVVAEFDESRVHEPLLAVGPVLSAAFPEALRALLSNVY